MKSCKGQIFATDLLVALTVLLFILVISSTSFSLIQNSLNSNEFYFEMQKKAITASQVLISTEGKPDSWQKLGLSYTNSIGLAKENNVLDENKTNTLIDWNSTQYEKIKEILGLQKYEFYFKITEMNGQTVKEFGIFPETKNKTIVIERYILFEKKERKFILGVFN